ncbi:unnamed protein product [Closterium sp. NIES-53]
MVNRTGQCGKWRNTYTPPSPPSPLSLLHGFESAYCSTLLPCFLLLRLLLSVPGEVWGIHRLEQSGGVACGAEQYSHDSAAEEASAASASSQATTAGSEGFSFDG